MLFKAPKNFTVNFILDFLSKIEKTFDWKQKAIPNVQIDLSEVEKTDILGLLIFYKFIDYTYANYCFRKPQIFVEEYYNNIWSKYEFDKLIQAYIANNEVTEKPFKEFKVILEDKFIIAPQALLRESNYSKEYLEAEFIPKIEQYYENRPKIPDLIFSCFSEILLNFWEHAVSDTKSVILADGNQSKIEIACADTGTGIITNLQSFFANKYRKEELLTKAVERGITSKPKTNHMGFGLWIVNELVTANNGRLRLISQGYYFYNDFGKIKSGKCAYWPGTIIYVNLNLDKPRTLVDVLSSPIKYNLKINFTS